MKGGGKGKAEAERRERGHRDITGHGRDMRSEESGKTSGQEVEG